MVSSGLYRLGARAPRVPANGRFYVAPGAVVIGDVRLEEDVSIWFNAVLRGDNEPIILRRGCNVQDGCVVHTDPGYPVEISEDVTVGHNATIHGCRIGKGSLVGMGAAILNGAQIGERCLIGAGALVRENMVIPDGALVLGVPAQVVRVLDGKTAEALSIGAQRYRAKARSYPGDLQPVSVEHVSSGADPSNYIMRENMHDAE
ncbi:MULTISPECIES: gamma carbonic anhydrase family protein [unclassified Ensifer]|jgi:carbonic anhydrase/acetyltransferase-like protein (isoleucine patch superfamily)|uniref:gamma carbonic anhydrase family protein n=1 Tax=unclassified Ensifer TaxID=2633371 RepID=UPI00088A51AD|nr:MULTISPECIES: gamma carbonic anhydrase family protein [unclassified Ensifer]MBD9597018.1 gamma carbonic anhydrase family protein [Ensifer sp. ENS05]SDM52282.1 Carbonic anhydrase or acetyltransferase, isoleucine patch superfamily [Ensifer sp. YR511]